MLLFFLHHCSSNVYYASFMLTPDCITRDTGTVGTSFRHAVDEANSESKTKGSSAASGYLLDYMDAIIHEPSKCEDLEHFHMTHVFWGGVGTYLVQHAKNKNLGKIPRG